MRIAVLGAGAWGTAIATTLAARHSIRLWARDRKLLAALRSRRVNERYLPGVAVPAPVELIEGLSHVLDGAELALLAVPTNGLRELLRAMRETGRRVPLVWLCKGFETERAKLPHEVCNEEMPGVPRGVLSGPSFADEVARGLPAALTLASDDAAFGQSAAAAVCDAGAGRIVHCGETMRSLPAFASAFCAGVAVLWLNASPAQDGAVATASVMVALAVFNGLVAIKP